MTKALGKGQRTVEGKVIIINRPGVAEQKSCSKCNETSGMITPDEAAALRGVSTRVIYRCLEEGEIHFIETAKGEVFICLKTLVANTKISESRLSKRPLRRI